MRLVVSLAVLSLVAAIDSRAWHDAPDFLAQSSPGHVINLALVSMRQTSKTIEQPRLPADVMQPAPLVERTLIDIKASIPKHYNPSSLTVNGFCNIFLEGGVCLAGEENEENKFAYQQDLIAYYDFDQEINVDRAGSKLAVNEAIKAGPGVDGKGASAFFNGDNYVTVDHYSKWDSQELRVSFWLYVIETTHESNTKMYCPLLLKGLDDFEKNHFDRFPGIFIQENTRRLRAFVSLANRDKYRDGIWTESIGRIPMQRWTHVSFAFNRHKLELSINGVLDSFQPLDGRELATNREKLYIGGHPSYAQGCKMAYYMDNLKVFDRLASQFAVEAEAQGAMGSVSPNSIMLGCLDCDFVTAKNACVQHFHLCTNVEVISGVAQAIRILGWVGRVLLERADEAADQRQREREGVEPNWRRSLLPRPVHIINKLLRICFEDSSTSWQSTSRLPNDMPSPGSAATTTR